MVNSQKKKLLNLTNTDKAYWTAFLNENCLPPFKYKDMNTGETTEFKSFSNNFLFWFFEKRGSKEFFQAFLDKEGDALYDHFLQYYSKLSSNEEQRKQLLQYIQNFSIIYTVENLVEKNNGQSIFGSHSDYYQNYLDNPTSSDPTETKDIDYNSEQNDRTYAVEKDMFYEEIKKAEQGQGQGFIASDEQEVNQQDNKVAEDLNIKGINNMSFENGFNLELPDFDCRNATHHENTTFIDPETYNRLNRDFATSIRRARKNDDSCSNLMDLCDRPLERSRDYEIWVYPDEIYPFIYDDDNNAVNNQNNNSIINDLNAIATENNSNTQDQGQLNQNTSLNVSHNLQHPPEYQNLSNLPEEEVNTNFSFMNHDKENKGNGEGRDGE
eukprot:CAMPEP_0170526400 /NCGR_PEP_ID=MMETSP0209-20121228/11823_1 /TAXON_ID=665100 ORGANISM="Litonotus pictus, Strain P1" /NCGR_SAMPLE_ID=MMETSP0209 /ASSEMBLY_ACC=CAM_ASM_000301 /LENGTH=381 /DNA_ID=CAMNT_0010816193 /DNA_START=1736 /DNA_END=2881 /DNA_ORIENTATION=-